MTAQPYGKINSWRRATTLAKFFQLHLAFLVRPALRGVRLHELMSRLTNLLRKRRSLNLVCVFEGG